MKRMSSYRYEKVKLAMILGGAVILLGYLSSQLSKKSDDVPDDVRMARSPTRYIKPDLIPLKSAIGSGDMNGKSKYGSQSENGTDTESSSEKPAEMDAKLAAAILEKITDRSHSLEEEPYYYLANWVNQRSLKELSELSDPIVSWRDLFLNPKDYRGKVVQVTGGLKRLRVTPLPPGNPTGLKQVYTGQVVDKRFRFWTFIMVEKPWASVTEGDIVRVYGAFFKVWEYETQLQNTYKISPVVIGRNFVAVNFDDESPMVWIIIGLVVLTFVILFISVNVARMSDAEVEAVRRKKGIERRPKGIDEIAKRLSEKAEKEQAGRLGNSPDSDSNDNPEAEAPSEENEDK